jgi:enamine deaminase RidA (YjgF/YER057c/UK114 family)
MGVEFRNVEDLSEPPGYSHVAVASGARLVFTAGAVPLDARGELVGPDDAEAQTEQVLANLLRQLEAGGATPADVVKTTVYVAGGSRDSQSHVWSVVQRSSLAAVPSTLVGVTELGYRGQLVEIEAIAVVEDDRVPETG